MNWFVALCCVGIALAIHAGILWVRPDLLRLSDMMLNMDTGSFAKLALGPFVSMTEATFSGIYSTASEMTDWLSYERYAGLVSGGTFQSGQLATAEVDVFVCLDIKTLDNHSGLARVIFGALLNALYNADGAVANRVAFLRDEAARLGHMKIIETARDASRKYGITMVMIYACKPAKALARGGQGRGGHGLNGLDNHHGYRM